MESSGNDSDIIESSWSESKVLVPNSDEENDQTKIKTFSKHSNDIISSSDEDSNSSTNITNVLKCQEDSDGSIKPSVIKKHSQSCERSSVCKTEKVDSSCESIRLCSKKKKKFVILSDEDSEDSFEKHVSHADRKSITTDINKSSDDISPFHGSVFSSTRLFDDDNNSSNNTSKKSTHTDNRSSFINVTNKEPLTIDLTHMDKNKQNKTSYRTLIEDESDEDSNNERVIIVESESEDDKSEKKEDVEINEDEINHQLNSMSIASCSSKNQSNDYLSRMESLRAEETRLKCEVSEVQKNIDTIKTTMKTANLSALPDKGFRLQISLKKEEGKIRDLRYQQSSIANEIIKLQLTAKFPQPIKAAPQPTKVVPQPKVFKLPTTNTDVNAMGKKALETHRTQQALTVDALKTLHKSLENCPSEETYVSDPKGLLVTLMPHQKHALAWLLWRENEKPSGGILADDMGLGKTLTMISLILKSAEEKNEANDNDESEDSDPDNKWLSAKRDDLIPGRTLVVCPSSLTGQWENEIKNKLKRNTLDVMIHHGSNREKKARRLARHDVVITTYAILPREETSEGPIFGVRWKRVILDEGHQIRNYKTQTAQSVYKLKAKHRWVLTGTPIHNREIDLYSLLKFLRCSPFDDLAVWKRWVDNRDAAGIQRLNTITKSLMLRRTKKTLQEQGKLTTLKERSFHTIFSKFDKDEQTAYEKLLKFSASLFAQFLHQKAEGKNALPGASSSSKSSHYLKNLENPFQNHPDLARLHSQMKQISNIKTHHILVLLLRLRQFCCHPALITKMFDKEDMSNDGIEDADGLDLDLMDKMTRLSIGIPTEEEDTEDNQEGAVALSAKNPLFDNDRLCSKMKKILNTLEDILRNDTDKVVVVSQWLTHLEVVHKVLKEKKIKCLSLNGSVPVKDRARIVEAFNRKGHGPRVILLTLTAGGVGLNLVGGNHLLLLDLHWNPQLENQACDRIYRVGQEKDVQIYKFVVSDSIEERILKLQETKLSIANDVLTGAKHISKLTLDDLQTLFQVRS